MNEKRVVYMFVAIALVVAIAVLIGHQRSKKEEFRSFFGPAVVEKLAALHGELQTSEVNEARLDARLRATSTASVEQRMLHFLVLDAREKAGVDRRQLAERFSAACAAARRAGFEEEAGASGCHS